MTILKEFQREVESYLASMDYAETDFGMRALKDPAFVSRLRAGRDYRASTIDKVRAFMRANPPQIKPASPAHAEPQPEDSAA